MGKKLVPGVGNLGGPRRMGLKGGVRGCLVVLGSRGGRDLITTGGGASGWEQVVGVDVFCAVGPGSQLRGVQREA